MLQFKIDNYISTYKKEFPLFITLNKEDKNSLLSTVFKILNIPKGSVEIKLFEYIIENLHSKSVVSEETRKAKKELDEDTYDLKEIFRVINYPVDDEIYIIWSCDEIDKMKTKDVIEYWDDIWYAYSDNAVILFNKNSSKIVLITHWGTLHYN